MLSFMTRAMLSLDVYPHQIERSTWSEVDSPHQKW